MNDMETQKVLKVPLKRLHPDIWDAKTVNINSLREEHKKTLYSDASPLKLPTDDEKDQPSDTRNARKRNCVTKDSDTCSPKKKKSNLSRAQIRKNKRDFQATLANIKNNDALDESEKSRWSEYIEANEPRLTNDSEITHKSDAMFSWGAKTISGIEFISLAVRKKELEGIMIDFIIEEYHQREGSAAVQYIPTGVCESYFNSKSLKFAEMFSNDKDCAITVYNLKFGKRGHWLFLGFVKKATTLYVLDPLSDDVDRRVSRELLKRFNQTRRGNQGGISNQNEWNFTDKWTVKTIPHSHQTDFTSCGLFCAGYALNFLKNFPNLPPRIDVEKDMIKLRNQHTATFLKNANEKK